MEGSRGIFFSKAQPAVEGYASTVSNSLGAINNYSGYQLVASDKGWSSRSLGRVKIGMTVNSSQLVDYGFGTWKSFSLTQENTLLTLLPKQIDVYVIRDSKNFGRYKGESDIVYIDSTISSSGLKRRIRFYFHPGSTQHTSQRIHNMLKQIHTLEISWIRSNAGVDTRRREKKLLNQYFADHLELPPFNKKK